MRTPVTFSATASHCGQTLWMPWQKKIPWELMVDDEKYGQWKMYTWPDSFEKHCFFFFGFFCFNLSGWFVTSKGVGQRTGTPSALRWVPSRSPKKKQIAWAAACLGCQIPFELAILWENCNLRIEEIGKDRDTLWLSYFMNVTPKLTNVEIGGSERRRHQTIGAGQKSSQTLCN